MGNGKKKALLEKSDNETGVSILKHGSSKQFPGAWIEILSLITYWLQEPVCFEKEWHVCMTYPAKIQFA